MAITKAEVYDIHKLDTASICNDVFALDTNVLYWMHYTRCSTTSARYQLEVYPNFIADLIKNNNRLVTTIYNITELLYIIERNEYEIYKLSGPTVKKKEFRDILAERSKVKNELEVVLEQIKEIYEIKNFNIDVLGIEDFVSNLENHKCDDFDYLVIKYLSSNGIKNILADDCDYITMDNIRVFTANNTAISKAKSDRKLVNP